MWRVNEYMDAVSSADRRGDDWLIPRYRYFDTQAEAFAFVVARAERLRDEAKAKLVKAERRLARVRKKFAASDTASGPPAPGGKT